jgi:hypothetical protein
MVYRLLTMQYQLQRLFSIEWDDRMIMHGEIERMRKKTAMV